MRIGLIAERKVDFPRWDTEPKDLDSELLTGQEEDELVAGLRDAGHQVSRIGDAEALMARLEYWGSHCDLFFNRSVGYGGLEGKACAPAALLAKGFPFVGSDPSALSKTRHKHTAKLVVTWAGIATPRAALWDPNQEPPDLESLSYPILVKPVWESSSIGIGVASKAHDPSAAAARAAFVVERYKQPALIEQFVEGLDVEVPLLIDPKPQALGCVALTGKEGQIIQGGEFLTSESIYDDGYGFTQLPAGVDPGPILQAAVRAAAALTIRDYGRIDFRVAADGTPWFIEASTHPHIQKHSSFNFLAGLRGLSFSAMLDEILQVAVRRYQNSIRHQSQGSR